MPDNSQPITLQSIADASGYARSTVSLALRNHPSIPADTRQKIREVADRLHYRPNPLVAALMSQLRDRNNKHQERLALICRFKNKLPHTNGEGLFYNLLYKALIDNAEKQGLGIDEFYMGTKNFTDHRLSSILVSRNIHGVIFFPGLDEKVQEFPELEWEKFATVLIGYNTTRENLHQVASNY
ncbi:MAG: LacI family DNA-binding transcriptional regulator, partial [Puniceicoccales bacterium]